MHAVGMPTWLARDFKEGVHPVRAKIGDRFPFSKKSMNHGSERGRNEKVGHLNLRGPARSRS